MKYFRSAMMWPALCMTLLLAPASALAASSVYDAIETMISEGRQDEAAAELKRLIEANDTDVLALAAMGDLCRVQGERKAALTYLNRAIKANPDYPPSYLALGKTYLLERKDEEARRAFDLFKEKMANAGAMDAELTAFYINALHQISALYYEAKEYDAFLVELQEIIDRDPNDQRALFNMGIFCYAVRHDRQKAYQYFTRVLSIDKDSRLGKRAAYVIDFMRANPDARFTADLSFVESY